MCERTPPLHVPTHAHTPIGLGVHMCGGHRAALYTWAMASR